jgi:hypothetical protein
MDVKLSKVSGVSERDHEDTTNAHGRCTTFRTQHNNNNNNSIALVPLTNKLNRADCGYQVHGTERKISHLLYMDDLKLLGRNENDLKN